MVLAAASLASGCADESPRNDGNERLIARYCEYGAVSQAQLDGCLDHVKVERIEQLETQAALYAQDADAWCSSEAGPFCSGAADPWEPPPLPAGSPWAP